MSDGPRVISVIVPALNSADTLPLQLQALEAQDYEGAWEIVIADNGSTDATVEVATRHLEQLERGRVVHARDRRSASHARNVGAARAEGDFLAFTDADDVVSEGWLSALARAAPHGDLVAGSVDVDELSDELSRSWHRISPRDRALRGLRFLPYASGANLGVWAHAFRRLGGFDERTPIGEDVELSWRAQLASYRLREAPDAVVHERLRRHPRAVARQHVGYGLAAPHLYRRGESGALLYRNFRDAGMPRSDHRECLADLRWLLRRLPHLARPGAHRGKWVRIAAFRVGRLVGGLRVGVVFP